MTVNALAAGVSPGSLANSATQVATLGPFTAADTVSASILRMVEADINVSGVSGTNVFMRITETVSSTVIGTSQIQLSSGGGTAFASMRCAGLFNIPSGSPMNVAYMLEAWCDNSASIGTGSGIFAVRGAGPRDL